MTVRVQNGKPGDGPDRFACTEPCPVERGMRILGGKWTGSILWHLRDEPVRFNALARHLAGASKKMIAERLRQLEDQGLVQRRVLDTGPVAVEYSLTQLGRSALHLLDELRRWTESLPPALSDSLDGDD